jgi:hypothetical protein
MLIRRMRRKKILKKILSPDFICRRPREWWELWKDFMEEKPTKKDLILVAKSDSVLTNDAIRELNMRKDLTKEECELIEDIRISKLL